MARRVVGLDLGAYSVKLVRLECGKKTPKFEVMDVVEEPIPVDERELFERQRDVLVRLQARGLFEGEAFAVGLEADEGQMRCMTVPFLDNRKIEAVLPGLLEAEVPFDIQDMITSWNRIEQPSMKEGGGDETECSIRIAFGKKEAIARKLQTLQSVSIDPRLMHLSSPAPFELIRELGFDAFSHSSVLSSRIHDEKKQALSAIIDFGHSSTNLCIFDSDGIRHTRTFLRGGRRLTEEIAHKLDIPFIEAQELKEQRADLEASLADAQSIIIDRLTIDHHQELCDEISRTFISMKTSGVGEVLSVAFIGGGTKVQGFQDFFKGEMDKFDISVLHLESFLPPRANSPTTALSLAYALSCLQIHAKDSRFNFRKDDFVWRGDLDFLRANSAPLILWGLVLICSLTILWSASSLVLEKENSYLEGQLKAICGQILGQKNVSPKRCLAMMKEQISANVDIGIPEFTASDVYLRVAQALQPDIKVTVNELDVLEKKVRIAAETDSFESVDKVVTSLGKMSCFVNVEKGRAQQVSSGVKFNLSADLDCSPVAVKPKQP